ncbi:MAG: hypothetical protein JW745_08960 [Sedimentisphaerales bacterium]|nr:hypothetical protein [Sedimentisphaerales bacterium]MBN2843647.1 hypothetical protein [Sedimentisphaerales bacterium]
MLCLIFKYKISKAVNKGFELDSKTLRHISACRSCHDHYNKLVKLGSALSQMPGIGLDNYDFNLLNQKIYHRLDKTNTPISLPARNRSLFSDNYALAATILLATSLAIVFLASDTNNQTPYIHQNKPTDMSATNNQHSLKQNDILIASSPQIALLYQLSALQYDKLADMSYKKQYERSKEVYARTSEITEKSTVIISALAQSSFYFLRPF